MLRAHILQHNDWAKPRNLWVFILAIMLVIIPFIGIENIAFIDFPNHLARYHIKENYDNSEALQSFYNLKDGFYPYWGMEGFMTIFTPLLGVETAGRYFVIASLLTPVIGTLLIAKAVHGRISLLTLAACIFIFSEVASWGFVNFLFTLGIAMCVFAAWIQSENLKPLLRIILFAALALMICTMHMICAGFLGLFIGFWELYPIIKARKITRQDIVNYIQIALIFIPAGLLILLQSSDEFGGQDTFYGSVIYRIQSTQSVFNFMADLNRGLFFSLFIGIITLFIFVAFRRDKGEADKGKDQSSKFLSISPRLGFMAVVFFALSLIVPFAISGVAYINIRFPLIAFLLLCASIKDLPQARPIFISLLFAALLLAKAGWSHHKLAQADNEISELRRASQVIPRGVRVLPVGTNISPADENLSLSMVPLYYTHQVAWLTIERDSLFPYFFSMFNVGINPAFERQTVPHAFAVAHKDLNTGKVNSYAKHWQDDFDYILLMHFGKPLTAPQGTEIRHKGSWFDILEITSTQ